MNVVLIDWVLTGHHFSFNCQFSRILLENGCSVFLAAPESVKIEAWIDANVSAFSHEFYSIEPLLPKRIHRKIFQPSLIAWLSSADTVKNIEKKFMMKVDFVFFSWFDSLLSTRLHPFCLDRIFKWKWSGLYFHPRFLRLQPQHLKKKLNWRDLDSPFLSQNCVAVCIHDRSIAQQLELYRYGKPVLCFPETADITEAAPDYPVAHKIHELSAGRIVVGLIGCEPHKGLQFSIELAMVADPKKFFFVFAGVLPSHCFSNELRNQWASFVDNLPPNCFISLGHIEEGAAYNSLFASIDIHLMFYEDFVSSSNRLTKAACLRRFVLTDNQYCVGDDVRSFGLGKIVPTRDLQQALTALDHLRTEIQQKNFPLDGWKQYAELNSFHELEKSFRELLAMV